MFLLIINKWFVLFIYLLIEVIILSKDFWIYGVNLIL